MEFSQRLQIFDKRPPFVAGQCRTDDAGRQLRYISLLALERVSAIAVAEKRYVEICQASRARILVVGFRDNADIDGIEFTATNTERRQPLVLGQQHVPQRRHGAVVQIGRRRPNAVEWARTVMRRKGENVAVLSVAAGASRNKGALVLT